MNENFIKLSLCIDKCEEDLCFWLDPSYATLFENSYKFAKLTCDLCENIIRNQILSEPIPVENHGVVVLIFCDGLSLGRAGKYIKYRGCDITKIEDGLFEYVIEIADEIRAAVTATSKFRNQCGGIK